MNKYKVSLIIPCYNAIDYLEYMFDSVKSQSIGMDELEIIFVYDTNSNDNTLFLLEKYDSEYSNIKLILFDNPTNNAGLPRNEGLRHVTSPYIIFLDSDDALELDAVEVLYNTIVEYKVDIVKSNYSLLVDGEKIKLDSTSDEPIIIKAHSGDLSKISDDMVWATIYRTNFLRDKNITFSNSLLGEDTMFIATCLVSTDNNIILLDNFYSVIYTSDNIYSHSHTVSLEKLEDNIATHRQIIDLFKNTNQNENYIKNTLKRFILNSISNTLRSNESNSNKRNMIDLVSSFIVDYEDYVLQFSLVFDIFYKMFKNKRYVLLLISSYFIRFFFNSKLLSRIQLIIRKKGWNSLKEDDNDG